MYRVFAIMLGCAVVVTMHHTVLFNPDGFIFSDEGDAIKNYFTFAWHVKYDPNWMQFQGTNYPYGDHVGYTDGHPVFWLLSRIFPWIQQYPVGFLHLFLLSGIVIACWFLFEILILWGCSGFFALCGAFSIYWLNPQIYRIGGHMALSHFWMLPGAILLFSLWLKKKNSIPWFILLIAFQLFVYFIHAYPGCIISLFLAAAGGFYCVQQLWIKKKWPTIQFLQWALFTALPPLVFYLFMHYTDDHVGRPVHTKGFLEYTSNWSCVLVPNGPPFQHFMQQIIHVTARPWEGWAYIGIATIIACLTVTFFYLKKIILWRTSAFFPMLISACLILLFSFGYPFSLGYAHWLAKFPLIEQFRAPGRFAWIFYYCITLAVFVLISKLKVKNTWAWIMVALFYVEGREAQWTVAEKMVEHQNPFRKENLSEVLQSAVAEIRRDSSFQFIVPQPLWHFGSDYYKRMADPEFIRDSYLLAFHTGIPLMSSGNPRASLVESRKILQFTMPDTVQHDIYKDLPQSWCAAVFRENERSVLAKCQGDDIQHQPERRNVLIRGPAVSGKSDVYHVLARIEEDEINNADSLWAICPIYFHDEQSISIVAVVEKIDSTGNRWIAESSIQDTPYNFQDSAWLVIPFVSEKNCAYQFFLTPTKQDIVSIQTGIPVIVANYPLSPNVRAFP